MPLGHPTDQELILWQDGSSLWTATGGGGWTTVAQTTSALFQGVNEWGNATSLNVTHSLVGVVFPQSRNITAFSAIHGSVANYFTSVETSSDTTNLSNGNWVQRYDETALTYWKGANTQKARQPWVVDWPNTKAVRFSTNGLQYFNEFHLWGNYTRPGLALWDAALDQVMGGANLDFGDIAQGSITDRQFRIKNNYSLTANNVVITAPTGGVGDVLNTLQFSNGGAYANSVTITSIAPGAISPVITARRTVGAAAPLQIGCARVTATAGSWT